LKSRIPRDIQNLWFDALNREFSASNFVVKAFVLTTVSPAKFDLDSICSNNTFQIFGYCTLNFVLTGFVITHIPPINFVLEYLF
jgi:hypothetical protein